MDFLEKPLCSDAAYEMACSVYKTEEPTYEQVNRCEDIIEKAAEEYYSEQNKTKGYMNKQQIIKKLETVSASLYYSENMALKMTPEDWMRDMQVLASNLDDLKEDLNSL